jgi:hypothetical protein
MKPLGVKTSETAKVELKGPVSRLSMEGRQAPFPQSINIRIVATDSRSEV